MADDHLARTSAYFDGELPEAEHADVLAHLAQCAECQSLLGAAVSLDAAASRAPKVAAVVRSGRRWWLAAGGAAVAAAAAIALWLGRRPHEPAPQVAIELPHERAVEARFSGELFVPYRPRAVVRGDVHAREPIALGVLANLEKRDDRRDLVAALASSGDIARAEDIAAKLPADPRAEADRAALALIAGDPERALGHAYAASTTPAGAWNLGLAARDLGLPYVAAQAFERVAAAGEPGWSADARTLAAADPWLARARGFAAFQQDCATMIAGGAVVDAARAAEYPAYARVAFYDALRTARSRDEVERLRPLAKALDAESGTTTATAAADRVAASDFAVRARFVDDYRALVAHTLPAERTASLVAQLEAAGPAAADLYVGAAILAGQAAARLDKLRAISAPWHDPWFDLFGERERIRKAFPDSDLRAEPALVHALAACGNAAWAMRCGGLEQDLAQLLFATGRDSEAEAHARAAVDDQRRAAMPMLVANARALLADIHRRHGRFALARAELEEVIAEVGDRDPRLSRYAQISRANVAFAARDLAAARALLPAPVDPCCAAVDPIGFATAIDLARLSGDAHDRERAEAWIAAARDAHDDVLALIGAARIDGAQIAALHDRVATLSLSDATAQGLRTYAFATLITDAGTHQQWDRVLALAVEEHPIAAAPCMLAASADDDRLTVAARTPDGVFGETGQLAAAPVVSSSLVAHLAHCTGVAVIARPPLHGRGDLLPANLPWWFAGDSQARGVLPAPVKRAIQVVDARPPDASLPHLPAMAAPAVSFDATLAGADATPARVLAALGDATYAELDVHGIAAATHTDAAYLALSPEPSGVYALRAGALRKAHFAGAPVVVLAACRAAQVAPLQRERWSLPDAFLAAGARAVIAADVEIPDAQARAVFDDLHRRIAAGTPIAQALAEVRAAHGDWASHLMLFQ